MSEKLILRSLSITFPEFKISVLNLVTATLSLLVGKRAPLLQNVFIIHKNDPIKQGWGTSGLRTVHGP